MGIDPVNAPIPLNLATFVARVRGAVDELREAQSRLVPRKKVPPDTTGAQEDAMLERERAIGAMNALEFEIAPALDQLDLQAAVNQIYQSAKVEPRDHFLVNGIDCTRVGERITAITRPTAIAFRIAEIRFSRPDRWYIHDIRIGIRSQMIRGPASMFHGVALNFETVQTAMDVTIEAEYLGPEIHWPDEPVEFEALVLGTSAGAREAQPLDPDLPDRRDLTQEEQDHILDLLHGMGNPTADAEPPQPMPGPYAPDNEIAVVLIDTMEAARRSMAHIEQGITITTEDAQHMIDGLRAIVRHAEQSVARQQQLFDDIPPEPTE